MGQVTDAKNEPQPAKRKSSDLMLLRKKLNACIEHEAYEDAAKLRDEIQKYEKAAAKKKTVAKRGSE